MDQLREMALRINGSWRGTFARLTFGLGTTSLVIKFEKVAVDI